MLIEEGVALAAGAVDATHELYINRLIDFIEENYAQPIAKGEVPPVGWVLWDPEKTHILTGERISDRVARETTGVETRVVPRAVKTALDNMSGEYNAWPFRMLTRVSSPWRTFLLTFSPRWYINNFVGNTLLATAEGVRMTDWVKAYRQWRTSTLPNEVAGHAYVSSLVEDTASTSGGAGQSVINRGVRETLGNEGVRAATDTVMRKMRRFNEAYDEIARAAVFERHLRSGASRAKALERAYDALVDYGNLWPLERGAAALFQASNIKPAI